MSTTEKQTKIEVLGPRLIVKPFPPPARESGIELPSTVNRADERRALVLAVGSRRGKRGQELPLDMKPGDIIRYEHGGMAIDVDGETLLFLAEHEVYAVEDFSPEAGVTADGGPLA